MNFTGKSKNRCFNDNCLVNWDRN